jgi:hypothetical protein
MAEEVALLEFSVTRGKTLNMEKIKWGFHCTLKSMGTFP